MPYRRNSGDLDTNHNVVFIYPAEFNPHPGISYRPIKNQYYAADWTKNIILTDRMGSTKLVIGHDFEEGFRYLPFGKQIPMGDDDQRTAYIGKELDRESELGDHGVRKVDYGLGRFTTIDPLWEKYYAWSPYQYSMNNPVSFLDENGLFKEVAGGDGDGKGYDLVNLDKNGKRLPIAMPIDNLGSVWDVDLTTESGTTIPTTRRMAMHDAGPDNCVGFAFTETQVYQIDPSFTDKILKGDKYENIDKISEVQTGDVVVFRNTDNVVTHAGIVSKVIKDKDGNVKDVIYKWRDANTMKYDKTDPKNGDIKYNETSVNDGTHGKEKKSYYRK